MEKLLTTLVPEHRTLLFCQMRRPKDCDWGRQTELRPRHVRCANQTLSRRFLSGLREGRETPLWESAPYTFDKSDLPAFARQLVGEKTNEPKQNGFSTVRYQLKQQVLDQLFDPLHELSCFVRLTSQASRRLDPNAVGPILIPIKFVGLRVYSFASGIALAECEVIVLGKDGDKQKLPTVAELLEFVFALTHSSDRFFQGRLYLRSEVEANQDAVSEKNEESCAFSLITMIETLTGMATDDTRLFHYTAARIDTVLSPAEKKEFATRLSHRTSLDYAFADQQQSKRHYALFDNVDHCFALEGGATILDGSEPLRFISEFISSRWIQVYVPLAIISLHGYRWLRDLRSQEALDINFAIPPRSHIDVLTKIRNSALQYRLGYRFSTMGPLTPHVTVHALWRDTFDLAKLEEELSRDVVEIVAYLEAISANQSVLSAQRVEKKWRPLAATVASLGSSVLTLELFDGIIRIKFDADLMVMFTLALRDPSAVAGFANLVHIKHEWEIAALVAAMCLGLVVAWKTAVNPHQGGAEKGTH